MREPMGEHNGGACVMGECERGVGCDWEGTRPSACPFSQEMATMARPNLSPSELSAQHPVLALDACSLSSAAPAQHRRPSTSTPSSSSTAPRAPYQPFSAIRSTHEAPPERPVPMLPTVCTGDECAFDSESPYGCQECAQECEDGSCAADLELTSQCTDQCVVVACNDAHHGQYPCEHSSGDQPCRKDCPSDFDFVDEFVSTFPSSPLAPLV